MYKTFAWSGGRQDRQRRMAAYRSIGESEVWTEMDSIPERGDSAAISGTAVNLVDCPFCEEKGFTRYIDATVHIPHGATLTIRELCLEPFDLLLEWFEDWCSEHHRRLEEKEVFSAALDKAGWLPVRIEGTTATVTTSWGGAKV